MVVPFVWKEVSQGRVQISSTVMDNLEKYVLITLTE